MKEMPKRRKIARPGEILAAALAEFEAKGFADTTFADIAKRAGIARATIYLYFDSKDRIFDALTRRILTDPLEEMGQALDAYDGTSEALLERFLTHLHSEASEAETILLLRILVSEGRRFPDLVRLHHARINDSGLSLLQRIIRRGIDRGEFAPEIADLDLRVVIAPAIMALFWQMIFASIAPLDREAMLRSHLDLVLRSLRPVPAFAPSGMG
ncbi:MAG: TetR/AcrR family transcriptional regulator [Pseudomonadota bacterium]